MQKIVTFLWYDNQAEEAVALYTSLFPNSKVRTLTRYSPAAAKASGQPENSVMTASFELDGQQFIALNGGPTFHFTEAISLTVNCKDQAEVDYYWDALTADGGEESQCGWLKDKFGLSWQIIPAAFSEIMGGPDGEGAKRAVAAMMQMKKLDVQKLQDAYDGKS